METGKLYKISEAAKILNVTQQTMRLWDKKGKLVAVHTCGGHRRYREEDINRLVNEGSCGNVRAKELLCEAAKCAEDKNLKNEIDVILSTIE